MKSLATILGLFFVAATQGHGKACFFNRTELIQKSLVIAIIDLEEPEASKANGRGDPFSDQAAGTQWSYAKRAKAKVIETIKGKIPKEFVLHGEESFICARCELSKGRFLAFLQQDEDLWVGTNWHLSLRPIKDGKIEWYDGEDLMKPMTNQSEAVVLAEIKKLLRESPKVEKPPTEKKDIPIKIESIFIEAGSCQTEKDFDWIVEPIGGER